MDNGKLKFSEEQRKAINHYKGPALVVAGPGSGKTLVITERVKYLIDELNVSSEEILVTTFTEKAANELKVRLSKSLGKKAEIIHISTIHSLCNTLLEDYFIEHNLGVRFDVLDEETQKLFVYVKKDKLGIWRWSTRGWIKKGMKEKDACNLYNLLTSNTVDIETLRANLKKKKQLTEENERLLDSYNKYRSFLDEEKKIDFDNLQLKFYNLLCNNAKILKEVRDRFHFILVDEYQDTSPLQDRIFRKIAAPQDNIFVVGDVNQSIYGFRGASVENFLNFNKHFNRVKSYYLSTNFRSTKKIVNVSNKLSEGKIKKELITKRREGERLVWLHDETADAVAKKTIGLIKEMKKKKIITKYGDVALLSRTKRAAEDYVRHLDREGLPYVSFGDGAFLTRLEVRTMIYLLSYVLQKIYLGERFGEWCEWWNADLFKTEVLGFSEQTKKAIDNVDKRTNIADFRTESSLRRIGITNNKDAEKIIKLNELRDEIEGVEHFESEKEESLLRIFYKILEHTEYLKRLIEKNDSESEEKLFNLARLSEIIGRYEAAFKKLKPENLFWFIYLSGRDGAFDQYKIEHEDAIKVMTIHKAKGLEFPVVFICSLVEKRFPLAYKDEQKKCLLPIDYKFYLNKETKKHAEEEFYNEELRLFYVGITRAQDNLIFTTSDKITTARRGKSRFLKMIEKYVTRESEMRLPIEMEYKKVEEIPNLTYSSINTYIDCPFRYMLVYKYGFETPRIFMQNIGIFVHNVLQRIHREMKDKNKLDDEKIEGFVNDYWIPVYSRKTKDETLKSKYLTDFINYYKKSKEFYDMILEIEKPFSHIGDNMIIKGKVDLVAKDKDGNVNLIDFKARKKEGIKDTNVDKQLKMYRYCLNDKHINRLVAYTFMDNQKTLFDFDEGEIEDFLHKMSNDMKSEKYDRNKGAFCGDCQFKFLCRG